MCDQTIALYTLTSWLHYCGGWSVFYERRHVCLRRRVAKCNKSRVRFRSAATCLWSEEYKKPLFYNLVFS